MKIGQTELKNNLILAPMAGVSDLPFRMLCAEQGAGLVCMEMVSAKAILFHNRNTEELMRSDEKERPVSLQLFGSDPQIISEMAEQIEEKPFDILDLNMGCPVPKVVRNGEGSALMRDPERGQRPHAGSGTCRPDRTGNGKKNPEAGYGEIPQRL